MDRLRRLFKNLVGGSNLAKHVATLVSGTGLSQLIAFLAMIPLARLYGPEQFGLFAIVTSLVTIPMVIASLRYDQAIVLPKSDVDARVLQKLASRSILMVSLLATLAAIVAHGWVTQHYGNEQLANWLIAGGALIYLTSQVKNRQFWLTRQQHFQTIATNRIISALSIAAFQILATLFTRGFEGLLVGQILGQLATLLLVNARIPSLRRPIPREAPTTWQMAVRYKKMPLLNGPHALLDSVRGAGINLLIGNISVNGLGQFSMAQKTIAAPTNLISATIGEVLLQRMSVTERGQLLTLVRAVLLRLCLVSIPVFVAFYFLAPWLLPLILGAQWTQAGTLAQAIVPWMLMSTIAGPLSNVFVVTETQGRALALAILGTIAPLTFLAVTSLDIQSALVVLGWIMALWLLMQTILAIISAAQYDQGVAQ